MAERAATYSQIITPEEYNRIISFEHVYISASDRVIKDFVEKYRPKNRTAEVVEIGCGPARLLPLIAQVPEIHLIGIDHDKGFLDYAKKITEEFKNVLLKYEEFMTWKNVAPIDIFYSQGVHHHIGKNVDTKRYLDNVVEQLSDGGVYILSDEFIPEYSDEEDRKVKAVIWYSHVIASAKRLGYLYLAQEEAKTLIDDLYECNDQRDEVKTVEQIEIVLDRCAAIDEFARANNFIDAERLAAEIFIALRKRHNFEKHGDDTVDLSRGDYKICDSVLRKELAESGLEVIESRDIGPVKTIGGMTVYVIRVKSL